MVLRPQQPEQPEPFHRGSASFDQAIAYCWWSQLRSSSTKFNICRAIGETSMSSMERQQGNSHLYSSLSAVAQAVNLDLSKASQWMICLYARPHNHQSLSPRLNSGKREANQRGWMCSTLTPFILHLLLLWINSSSCALQTRGRKLPPLSRVMALREKTLRSLTSASSAVRRPWAKAHC
jgi:hypothetical protein